MPDTDARNLWLCLCQQCLQIQPEGVLLSRSTFYRHKNISARLKKRRHETTVCKCLSCLRRTLSGRRVSHSTALRHGRRHNVPLPLPHASRSNQQVCDTASTAQYSFGSIDTNDFEYDDYTTSERLMSDDNSTTDAASSGSELDGLSSPRYEYASDSDVSQYEDDEEILDTIDASTDVVSAISDLFDALDHENDSTIGFDGDEYEDDKGTMDRIFLELVRLQNQGLSREMYATIRRILELSNVHLPSLRNAVKRLQQQTQIKTRFIDCCVNNCMAFTGISAETTICTYCNEARLSTTGSPRNQMVFIPLIDRLVLQYADAERSRVLKTYRHDITTTRDPGIDGEHHDVFDGRLYREFHVAEMGMFQDEHDIALHLSLDGVQITNMKTHEVSSHN